MTYHGSLDVLHPGNIEQVALRIQQLQADIKTLREQLNAGVDAELARRFCAMIEEKNTSIRRAVREYYDALDPAAALREKRRAERMRVTDELDGIAEEIDDFAEYFADHEEDVLGAREGLRRGMRAAGDRRTDVDTYMKANLRRSKRH